MKVLVSLLLAVFGATASAQQVSYERIVKAAQDEPQNWLTYSGGYAGHRYSLLTQVDRRNVGTLKMAWAMQMPSTRTETSPIVVDGIVYLTGPNFVFAVDGRTGRKVWTWRRPLPNNFKTIGFGPVNRGAAVLDDMLYVGALDGALVALDLKSGGERWVAPVADWRKGYAITVAPLAAAGKVIIGVSGGEAGVRGLLDAYDAKTGKRAWRFHTIPAAGEKGVETWAGDSWKTGGGPTWVTGSFDPETNVLYWGTGNPSPDWNGDKRIGDNLYTCSLLALDIATGKLRWYFQFTPHDVHDWDSNHVPLLFDAKIGGVERKLVAVANRNAFYYLLDRTNGAFISATQFAHQTWNGGPSTSSASRCFRDTRRRSRDSASRRRWRWCGRWPAFRSRRSSTAPATRTASARSWAAWWEHASTRSTTSSALPTASTPCSPSLSPVGSRPSAEASPVAVPQPHRNQPLLERGQASAVGLADSLQILVRVEDPPGQADLGA